MSDPLRWHQLTRPAAAESLDIDPAIGLAAAEAARRLQQHGPNELADRSQQGPLKVLWGQFTSLMVAILLGAAVLSAALGDLVDAIAILAIVLLNAALGFHQEYRAELAVAGLRKLSQPAARVVRDGHVVEIPSRDLVTGDIVLIEAGNLVSADARLLDAVVLRAQESALTGESEAVEKDAAIEFPADAALGDRRNMLYSGTLITHGRGRAAIVATGEHTELGRIAGLLRSTERSKTPLQIKLDQMSRLLAGVALAAVAVVVALDRWRGADLKTTFLTGVSLMVAAVPEGLPAMVTIALALGASRMLRRRALIRKLSAVETLGAVTVICTDKTGTLTENRMRVTAAIMGGREYSLRDPGRTAADRDLRLLLACGALANDAYLHPHTDGAAAAVGDPMEIALAEAARDAGLDKELLELAFPRVSELPFDAERRRMSTVNRLDADPEHRLREVFELLSSAAGSAPFVVVTKGAVVELLTVCEQVWIDGREEPLTPQHSQQIRAEMDRLAGAGERVLGFAFRAMAAIPQDSEIESGLTFLGMTSLVDPVRAEVPQAVETCRAAGIRIIMITGDYPLTAGYIAAQAGFPGHLGIVTGEQLAKLKDPASWDAVVRDAAVFARVTPQEKLEIIEALKRQGHVVAMTGDGVNDAPALKRADIGIAMGRSGTDVAREASTMVLQDDNFATIVAAVEEGRTLYDNLRKFTRYLLASNSGELWVMLIAPLIGMPLPLLPLQILWMNLVTDGLPGLALAMEPAQTDTMQRPPRPPSEGFFGRGMGAWILWMGAALGLIALGCGFGFWRAGRESWQTMLFTVLTLSQVALALALGSERVAQLRRGIVANRALLGAVGLMVAIQIGVVYLPAAQALLHTQALSLAELGVCLALAGVIFCGATWWERVARKRAAGAAVKH